MMERFLGSRKGIFEPGTGPSVRGGWGWQRPGPLALKALTSRCLVAWKRPLIRLRGLTAYHFWATFRRHNGPRNDAGLAIFPLYFFCRQNGMARSPRLRSSVLHN